MSSESSTSTIAIAETPSTLCPPGTIAARLSRLHSIGDRELFHYPHHPIQTWKTRMQVDITIGADIILQPTYMTVTGPIIVATAVTTTTTNTITNTATTTI